jgi:hypothetical protein
MSVSFVGLDRFGRRRVVVGASIAYAGETRGGELSCAAGPLPPSPFRRRL